MYGYDNFYLRRYIIWIIILSLDIVFWVLFIYRFIILEFFLFRCYRNN